MSLLAQLEVRLQVGKLILVSCCHSCARSVFAELPRAAARQGSQGEPAAETLAI